MAFSGIALVVTALAKSYDLFTYYFSLFVMPMMLISGVFFPASSCRQSIRIVGPAAAAVARDGAGARPRGRRAARPCLAASCSSSRSTRRVGLVIANRLIKKRLTK